MYENKNLIALVRTKIALVKTKKKLFVWGVVFVVMAAIAIGSAEQKTIAAGIDESTSGTDVETINSDIVLSADGLIEAIHFKKDTEIRKVLRFLAVKYKKNIVPSSNVNGLITVTSLYNVTFEQALRAFLGSGFKYEVEGNFIMVYTVEEYKKIKTDEGRMTYKVFTLYYISAAEAMKLVSPVLSSSGQIMASSAAEIGISAGTDGATGEPGGDTMALNDAIVIYDFPENIASAEKVIKQLDVRPLQVLIEATILSATLTEGMEMGVDWNLLQGVSLDGTAATADIVNTAGEVDRGTTATGPLPQIAAGVAGTLMESTGFASTALGGLRVGFTTGDVVGFITALESVTDITVLANPKILALNKQMGTVFIGQKLGYRDRTTISSDGTATVGEVKFLDTGTKLSFRPYIADDGYIRMDIYPKDSSGELDENGIPTETTAELTTNIMVKDGQTIVIGGLFRDAITTTRSQIPLLGDLPLIGAAFRKTTDTTRRQEVIILLTPHIIERAEQTDPLKRIADVERKRAAANQAKQWLGRGKLAEDYYMRSAKLYIAGDMEAAFKQINLALKLRPTFLEGIRLRERIINEEFPGQETEMIERDLLGVIEKSDTRKWLRR